MQLSAQSHDVCDGPAHSLRGVLDFSVPEVSIAQGHAYIGVAKQAGARWFAGEYDDYLVRRDGKWLFTHIKVDGKFLASPVEGWADQTG